jgi:hypothetical protein
MARRPAKEIFRRKEVQALADRRHLVDPASAAVDLADPVARE